MKHLRLAVVLVAFCAGAADAQQIVGTTQTVPSLNSKGPVSNPAVGIVLAEIVDIPAGPHVFRAVVTQVGAGAAVLVEWRDASNKKLKWSQPIIVTPESGTLVLPIEEPHLFEDGDRLRITSFGGPTVATVWATLSVQ